jgi:hypothetical protein
MHAQNSSIHSWCGNCTEKERSLHSIYISDSIPPDIDIFSNPIDSRLLSVSGQQILLIGDSLMREIFYSLIWVFPGSHRHSSRSYELLPHCRDVNFSINVVVLNTTVNYCPNTFLGPHMSEVISVLFRHEEFQIVVINSGLWYNFEPTVFDTENIVKIRGRNNTAVGWSPLSRIEYEEDLKLFKKQLKFSSQRNNISTSKVFWLQSSPQHFQSGTFHVDHLLTFNNICKKFSIVEEDKAYWRNRLTDKILSFIPTIRTFKALSDLYFSHPSNIDGNRDCTHYCNPGVALLFITQRILTVISSAS